MDWPLFSVICGTAVKTELPSEDGDVAILLTSLPAPGRALNPLAEPLPLEPRSLDGVTSSLALHYIRDWSVPLGSFASALRPGGWAVISLDHPFGERMPGQKGSYFDTELVTDTWRKADVEVSQRFWKRPLSAIADAFADAGFVIERIAEARPTPEAIERYPADLAKHADIPTFIVYRLRLTRR